MLSRGSLPLLTASLLQQQVCLCVFLSVCTRARQPAPADSQPAAGLSAALTCGAGSSCVQAAFLPFDAFSIPCWSGNQGMHCP
eukprot:462648-Pelagomonas_calceolata.AAC.6